MEELFTMQFLSLYLGLSVLILFTDTICGLDNTSSFLSFSDLRVQYNFIYTLNPGKITDFFFFFFKMQKFLQHIYASYANLRNDEVILINHVHTSNSIHIYVAMALQSETCH